MPKEIKHQLLMSEGISQSKSAAVITKTMYAAMKLLRDNDGSMPFSELRTKIAETVEFTEWEASAPSEKTSKPRWEINMMFYVIDYNEAGFIRKDAGTWYLTAEGEKALALSPVQVFEAARTAHRINEGKSGILEEMDSDIEEIEEPTKNIVIEDAEAMAMDGIRKYIRQMNPYPFQELVAALLRGMGFYTPFIADKGKDGGIDVVAYENAAGTGNRLIVQIKHMPTSSLDVTIIRNLAALLKKESDTGWVVTSGRFTSEARRFARECKFNVRLIDGEELVRLWIALYDRLNASDRQRLPLRTIFFLE